MFAKTYYFHWIADRANIFSKYIIYISKIYESIENVGFMIKFNIERLPIHFTKILNNLKTKYNKLHEK